MENVSEAENLEEGYIRHNRELRKNPASEMFLRKGSLNVCSWSI